jgi:hypothetical protein
MDGGEVVDDEGADEEMFVDETPPIDETDPLDVDVVPEGVEDVAVAAADQTGDAIGEVEDSEIEQGGVESWADVMTKGHDETDPAADPAQVEPPAEEDVGERPEFETNVEPFPGTEHEVHEAMPEIAEPDLDWVADDDDRTEVESWADVVDDDESAAAPAADESGPSAAETAVEPADVEEPIIPESLAQFDQPTSDDVDKEPVDVAPNDVPLPTVTLARLAIEQEDLKLAEATLAGVLDRNPADAEALRLLEEVRGGSAPAAGHATAAKVAALRGWLDTIRLASERQSS